MAAKALGRIAAELEAGLSDTLTHYLAASGRFRRQSWTNVLLIASQRPEATQVAGRGAWRAVGRFIRENEEGLVLFAPANQHPPAARPGQSKDVPFRTPNARATLVFDISQTEGKPLPEVAREKVSLGKWGERLLALAAQRGIELRADCSLAPARGSSESGTIRVNSAFTPVECALTLAREVLRHRPQAAGLSQEAIEAQAHGVAYVVARGLGIDAETATAEYLALSCRGSKALAQSLAAIHEGSGQILNALIPDQRPSPTVADASPRNHSPLEAERFAEVHREYADRLIESLAGFVRDRDRAEEIAARAFEKAWEKRGSFREEASVRTWIEAIARNDARHAWSQEARTRFEPIDRPSTQEIAALEFVTDELEKRDERDQLQKALARLPAKYRRLLIAHFVENLSIRDIARRDGVPFGTVLSRIHKGKQLLREAWDIQSAELAR